VTSSSWFEDDKGITLTLTLDWYIKMWHDDLKNLWFQQAGPLAYSEKLKCSAADIPSICNFMEWRC
jgi:hypothetical protein